VLNHGLGAGNGLLVDIEAGPDHLGMTIDQRFCRYENGVMRSFPTAWYSFAGDIAKAMGRADWYRFDSSLFANIRALGFKPVQSGRLAASLDFTPAERLQVVAGFENGADTASTPGGGISLRKIDGENLALGKPCPDGALTDGDLSIGHRYRESPRDDSMPVYLADYYRVTRLVLYTGGEPETWRDRSPRAFAAEISSDGLRWNEVGIIQEVGFTNADRGSYGYAEVSFPPQTPRFVRYHITAERDSFPNLGEIMVYGTGYTYTGEYTSPWIDCGNPSISKNLQQIT
jgi:hypothetical protein